MISIMHLVSFEIVTVDNDDDDDDERCYDTWYERIRYP